LDLYLFSNGGHCYIVQATTDIWLGPEGFEAFDEMDIEAALARFDERNQPA
jgi:hypothetical protein